MTSLKDIFASYPEVKKILNDYRDEKKVSVFGMQQFSRTMVTALAGDAIVVCPDFFTAGKFFRQLSGITDGITLLKEREEVLLIRGAPSASARERFTALGDICTGKSRIIVTTAQALMQLYPDRQLFEHNILTIRKGDTVDPVKLGEKLAKCGYRRESQLSDACQFARRGDILDVFPVSSLSPYRIEFFGDEVDKITEIDAETQLSVKPADSVEIYPFTDVFQPLPDIERIKSGICPRLDADCRLRAEETAEAVSLGDGGSGCLLPYVKHMTLLEFCSRRAFIIDECKRVRDAMDVYFSEHKQRYEMLYEKGETLSDFFGQVLPPEQAASITGAAIAFHAVTSANRFFEPEELYVFRTMAAPRYVGSHDLMARDIDNWNANGYEVAVCCGSAALKDRVTELLAKNNLGWSDNYTSGITVTAEKIGNGEILHDLKLVVIGENDLVGERNQTVRHRRRGNFIGEPKVGEYVVHDVHGIGICEGVKKAVVDGAVRDYVVVGYADGGKLYVPVENMDRLTRYVSGGTPRLNKMGGTEFAKQKLKARESIKKLAFDLKELYAQRLKANAYRYSSDDSLLREFENTFEYNETEDQLKAEEECLNDLKSSKIMDRLLCGDVGYGKTEVALRVAFKVICEGKQVAFMSPTTVLAKQHYETVKRRMEPFGIKTGRLTRFDSAAKIRETVARLKEGDIDIVVGTHRLLSKDVGFKDLGLLILDEEQRFGVGDKEKIKNLRREVNVLTLSATPIPRTLHMSLAGMRDMSLLETPPKNRLPVQTYVTEYSDALLYDAVMREMGRGGQSFIVYNRVEHIDEFAAKVARLVPDAKIVVAHGQMPEGQLEKAVDAFVSGQGDVMISSTIIENGVDIPRANTLVVIDADRMGLSQLYQLRGRVGRSDRTAYAFFTFPAGKVLSKEAFERLESIGKYTDLGSGFKIAMRDLEIRGAGNILGAEQHGHMEKVGYDMYCSLLEEVLDEMQGKPVSPKKEVKMMVDYSASVPDDYVADSEWKFKLYSRIARVNSVKERDTLLKEVQDLYGPAPDSVKNLINIALIKNLAEAVGASAVVMNKRESKVVFDYMMDISKEVYSTAVKCGAKLINGEKPALKFMNNNELLKFLLNCRNLRPKNV